MSHNKKLFYYQLRKILKNYQFGCIVIICLFSCNTKQVSVRNERIQLESQNLLLNKIENFQQLNLHTFIGYGIGCNEDEENAELIAENLAYSNLAANVKIQILSINKRIKEVVKKGEMEISKTDILEQLNIEASQVHFPNTVQKFVLDEWKNDNGIFCFCIIKYIPHQEFWDYYLSTFNNKKMLDIKNDLEILLDKH